MLDDRVAVEATGHGKVQGMTLHNRYHVLFEISDGTVIEPGSVSTWLTWLSSRRR